MNNNLPDNLLDVIEIILEEKELVEDNGLLTISRDRFSISRDLLSKILGKLQRDGILELPDMTKRLLDESAKNPDIDFDLNYRDYVTDFVLIKPDYKKLFDYKIKLIQINKKISKTLKNKSEKPLIELPPNTDWTDITIKLINDFDVEIEVKEKFLCRSNNEKMNFFKKNSKNKKPIEAWNFLKELSTNNGKLIRNPVVNEEAAQKDEKYRKRKEELSKLLKKCFGIEDDPFDENAGVSIYKVKFILKPIPGLRGNGEIRGFKDTHKSYLPNY
jgi:hypothetical protein